MKNQLFDSDRSPVVVCYGMGVDSTAMLVGLSDRGERPDVILFADTGSEKPETYAYKATIDRWLEDMGFPPITVVKNPRPKSGDQSLYEACHRNSVLPALAYGMHQCSLVWKLDPQAKFCRQHFGWNNREKRWAHGPTVVRLIGYDAGPADAKRVRRAHGIEMPGYENRYPLIEWGWDRERCKQVIADAGLPVPMKSACFMCPASKKDEIVWLSKNHPNLHARAIELEHRAKERGLTSIKGLGRNFAWHEIETA